MKCSECEKLIYLYNELDAIEKQKVGNHISTCASCASLLSQFQKEQSILGKALKEVPQKLKTENPFLTSKIMSSIQAENERAKISVIEQFLPVFRFQSLKYALAALSLVMLAFFIAEVDPVDQTKHAVSYYKKIPIRETVQLNSSAFRERVKNSFRNDRTQAASSFAGCLKACDESSQKNNCEECVSRFNKIKQNEGI